MFCHTSRSCKKQQLCVRCGKEGCQMACNKNLWNCVNCGGCHSAAYKGCPEYKRQLSLIAENAKLKSYAEVIKSSKIEIEKSMKKIENSEIITPSVLTAIISDSIVRTRGISLAKPFEIVRIVSKIVGAHLDPTAISINMDNIHKEVSKNKNDD